MTIQGAPHILRDGKRPAHFFKSTQEFEILVRTSHCALGDLIRSQTNEVVGFEIVTTPESEYVHRGFRYRRSVPTEIGVLVEKGWEFTVDQPDSRTFRVRVFKTADE
jgi:hypothetical protein